MLIRPHCDAFSTCLSFVSIVLMILRSYRFKRKRYIISATGVYTHTHIYIHVYIHTRTRCQSRRCKFISANRDAQTITCSIIKRRKRKKRKEQVEELFFKRFCILVKYTPRVVAKMEKEKRKCFVSAHFILASVKRNEITQGIYFGDQPKKKNANSVLEENKNRGEKNFSLKNGKKRTFLMNLEKNK